MEHLKSYFFAFLLLNSYLSKAQTENKTNNIFIGTEILCPILNGSNFEIGYGINKYRATLEYRQIDMPTQNNPNTKSFDANYKVIELNIQKYIFKEFEGLFAGIVFDYYSNISVKHKTSGIKIDKKFSTLGVRVGYTWIPFKKFNLYIEPAIQGSYSFNDKDIIVNSDVFSKKSFQLVGPLLKVGYKFNF